MSVEAACLLVFGGGLALVPLLAWLERPRPPRPFIIEHRKL